MPKTIPKNKILWGDCEKVLEHVKANSIDLIVTSPPYADSRNGTYGGIHPDKYADWFLPKTAEFLRVLKPTGTFVLNIKEKVVKGERHTYVLELIRGMRAQGWLWTEEYIWHKKNSYPGKWPNRFRDSWERCLQFNKDRNFRMYQEAVMVPVGDWAKSRVRPTSSVMNQRWGADLVKTSQTGLEGIWRIPLTCFTLQRSVAIKIIRPLFPKRCRSGSSNFLPKRAILCLIRLWGREPRQ